MIDKSIYIGPYYTISKEVDFDFLRWEHLVCCGRGESSSGDNERYLISNYISKEDRAWWLDSFEGVQHINPATIVRENRLFCEKLGPLLQFFDENEIEYRENWGIVVGYF